jgi:ketosteroid isomerase-like protein
MRFARVVLFALVLVGLAARSTGSNPGAKEEIERFNRRFVELHLKMDHDGILAMWADDGVDLMPDEAPLVGKAAITAWLKDILSKSPGLKVTKEELAFYDIEVSGDWASEWGVEHQATQRAEGQGPVDGYGKIALVLHRDANGQWKIKQEMWNSAPRL